jgi:nicotinamidase-related amidase
MKTIEFICVDLQNEFATEGGKFYTYKPSVDFLKQVMFPCFSSHNIKVNEIVSDYRQPRPGDGGDGCHPGEWGYESVLPSELRKSLWVKSMNSPIWIRENGGDENNPPGLPYPDSEKFGDWIDENIGKPENVSVVIFGLTIDCCVLSTVQEFRWRGYEPIIIKEAVDHASGSLEDRDVVLEKTALRWWAKAVSWEEFKNNFL